MGVLDKTSVVTLVLMVVSIIGFFAIAYGLPTAAFITLLGLLLLSAALAPKPKKSREQTPNK